MSCNVDSFDFIEPSPVPSVRTATGEVAKVEGQGTIVFKGINGTPIRMHNVLYIPSFTNSLLSISSIFDSGGHVQYMTGGNLVEIFSEASELPVLLA